MKTIVSTGFTRPDDTTQYSIGDVMGGLLTFTSNCPAAMVRSAIMSDSSAEATKPNAHLYFFSSPPTVAADNVAFAPTDAEIAECLGVLTFAVADFHTLGANGITHINPLSNPDNVLCAPGKFYGVLVAANTYTPVALEKFNITLGLET